jgi:hypothetical protein
MTSEVMRERFAVERPDAKTPCQSSDSLGGRSLICREKTFTAKFPQSNIKGRAQGSEEGKKAKS